MQGLLTIDVRNDDGSIKRTFSEIREVEDAISKVIEFMASGIPIQITFEPEVSRGHVD